jgi:hypothetical protein
MFQRRMSGFFVDPGSVLQDLSGMTYLAIHKPVSEIDNPATAEESVGSPRRTNLSIHDFFLITEAQWQDFQPAIWLYFPSTPLYLYHQKNSLLFLSLLPLPPFTK